MLLYLFIRTITFVILGTMMAGVVLVFLIWLILTSILNFLTEPAAWSPKYRHGPPAKLPSGGRVPRNPRMYYSNRR